MPNPVGNFLGLLGGIDSPASGLFNNMAAGVSPLQSQAQIARQQFQWQRDLFMNQLQGLMGPDPNNPRMSLNEALYTMSPEGQQGQYGYKQAGEARSASGASGPVLIHGGQPIYPPGILPPSFTNNPSPVGQTTASQNAGGANGPTATQGQGGGVGPLSPADQAGVAYKGAVAEAEAKGKAAGGAQPGFPAALADAHQKIAQIQAIINDPRLGEVVGRVAGSLPARYSSHPDLVNAIETADNAVRNQTFMGLRSISGRPASPGAIKEMQIGSLGDARLGTVEGMKAEGNRLIKQIQDETDAAWVGANSPAEFKPVWGKNEAPQQQQAIPPAAQRETGKIYNTPKGPHKWLGNGWEPAGNASL